jgi:hypothetical protein
VSENIVLCCGFEYVISSKNNVICVNSINMIESLVVYDM